MEKKRTFNDKSLLLDASSVARILEGFIKEELGKAGFTKGILGLSGGVDSALSAAIACRALGCENVLGVMMPYRTSNPASLADAKAVADSLDMPTRTVEITAMVDPYFDINEKDADSVRRGNVMARQRMIILYDLSAKEKSLVIGTSNRTESLLGYSTLWGDSAHAVNPLGDLLKTQVWQMSEYYKLPEQVVNKAPSADLWEGQTDEDELGFDYKTADKIIALLIDERIPAESISDYGFDENIVKKICRLIRINQYKRMPPLIAKLGHRTIGKDFRYPRDWGL